MRISIVVPFLNEEGNLPALLGSLAIQTRLPDHLMLLDDGSTDASAEIARAFAAEHPWAELRRRPPRDVGPDRLARGSAVRAFAWGVEQLVDRWDVVAKLDADIRLNPRTLETIEASLAADPELGIAGAYLSTREVDGELVRHRCRPEHVDGATKFYRRACFEAISPMPLMLGWDSIDEVRARLRGWRTGSVAVPGGDPEHLRPMSSHDGILRGYRRRGECAWCSGEPLLHVLLIGVQRLGDRPWVLAGACYIIGWAGAAVRRVPRAEPEVLAEMRRDTLTRIRRRARNQLVLLTRTS